MNKEEYERRCKELEAEYPELTQAQIVEASENVPSFGYPFFEMSERVLDAYAACLGGTWEQYYHRSYSLGQVPESELMDEEELSRFGM